MFGDQDPSAVFFREKPVDVRKEGGGYAMYIRLPFAEKDRIQVWTQGDELVVPVDNQRRHILLPRVAGRPPPRWAPPSPTSACGWALAGRRAT